MMKVSVRSLMMAMPVALILLTDSCFAARTARMRAPLFQCKSTSIEGSYLETYFKDTLCPFDKDICGSDPLTEGLSRFVYTASTSGDYTLQVWVRGANPWNLYRVYFVPLLANPCTDMVLMGDFMTNSRGNHWLKPLRNCEGLTFSPKCLRSTGPKVDPHDEIGGPDAGTFFIYSRGPVKDDDGNWKTDDKSVDGELRNPDLWNNADQFDGIQFVSGFP